MGQAFSFRDHVVKIVRSIDGKEKRLFSGNKYAVEAGPKTSLMKGFDTKPFAVVYGSAEPKWSLDGMSAAEVQDVVSFVGGIAGPPFAVIMTATRGGHTRSIKLLGCAIGEGGDWSADEGNGATGKLGGPMLDVLVAVDGGKFTSIYAPRNP